MARKTGLTPAEQNERYLARRLKAARKQHPPAPMLWVRCRICGTPGLRFEERRRRGKPIVLYVCPVGHTHMYADPVDVALAAPKVASVEVRCE